MSNPIRDANGRVIPNVPNPKLANTPGYDAHGCLVTHDAQGRLISDPTGRDAVDHRDAFGRPIQADPNARDAQGRLVSETRNADPNARDAQGRVIGQTAYNGTLPAGAPGKFATTTPVTMEDLIAAVAAEKDAILSVTVFIRGLQAQLSNAGTDSAKLQEILNGMTANSAALAAAIVTPGS